MRSMRSGPLIVVFALVVVLVGAIVLFTSGGDTAAPVTPPTTNGANQPNEPAKPVPGVRVDATPATPPTTTPLPAATPSVEATPPAAASDTGPGNLLLVVHDAASPGVAPTFRWRLKGRHDATTGNGSDGKAILHAPHDTDVELLVEADQRQAVQRGPLRGAAPGQPPLQVEVTLVPIVVAAGITLHVHDLAMQPMRFVRVEAFRIHDQNRDTTWAIEDPLWARRSSSEEGRYPLPQLPAGEYGIKLVGIDEQGALLPFLPYLRTFRLTGDNGFVEDVPLEPGCALVLELVDAHGNPYDPTSYGTASLVLRPPNTPPVQRKWYAMQGATAVTAIDVLPGIGKAALADAIPVGTYQLEVFSNNEPRVRQLLQLRAERQVERIVVP
jgi:hypothetical protein